jgi:hypothetical protein
MRRAIILILLIGNSFLINALDAADFYATLGDTEATFGDPNTGVTAFPMLFVPVGGRYEGMGTAFTAVSNDSSFLESNPSASSLLENSELSVLHNDWIYDTNVEGLVYTVRFNDLGIGFGGKFLYVPFTSYDTYGERNAGAYYSESLATINVSYNFFSSYRFYGLALGTNVKFAYRSIPNVLVPVGYDSQSALAALVDFGALTRVNFLKFYPSRSKNFSIGLVLKNLGPKVQSENLPTALTGGIAYSPLRPITLSYDLNFPLNFGLDAAGLTKSVESISMAGGVDVVLTDFFSMQGGFNYRGANPRISLGAVVELPSVSFVVNYTLDLTTQLEPFDRISIEATLNLGDRGRIALRAKIDELYLEGLEAYAEGDLDRAVKRWKEVLELDPEFEPAQSFLERALLQIENRTKLESVR